MENKLLDNLKEQFEEAGKVLENSFSISSGITLMISKTKQAVSELKEINTILTEISKENENLSKSELKKIAADSFDIAGKYGKKAADYLSSVKAAYSSGYKDAEGIAELSLSLQTACNMTADLADRIIASTDNAYKMNGSVAELTKVLDGMNYITNNNTVNMNELSEGMSVIGSTAADLGVDAAKAAAALGTMITATQQSGSEAASAFKSILSYIRQVSDEEKGITAEGINRYEKACRALNVSLKESINGVLYLRDPIEVLQDLSYAYSRLDENDHRKTDLLDSVGEKNQAAQLDALLTHWDTYEAMVQQYADGTGSMAAEAEKTADSWEGSLTRLSNTWTDTVGNIADSDIIIEAVNILNSLLSVINNITASLGSFSTTGLGIGIFTGLKNVGKPEKLGFILF